MFRVNISISCMGKMAEEYSELDQKLINDKLCLENGKPFPVSLTPYTIDIERYKKLGERCEILFDIIEFLIEEYINNPSLRDKIPENTNLNQFACIRPTYAKLLQFARFDLIEDQNGNFKVVELNCACAGGILIVPMIKDIIKHQMHNLPTLKNQTIIEQKIDKLGMFFDFLINTYRAAGGTKENPVIAYVNSNYMTITTDLNQFLALGEKLGLNVINVRTHEIECKNKKAYYKNNVIDIAHGRYTFFIDETNMARPGFYKKTIDEADGYLQAVKNNYFTPINSFPSFWIGENKKLLALIQEKQFLSKLNNQQLQVIKLLCPETIILNDQDKSKSTYIKREKDKYVIKSSLDTRGRAIYIGNQMSNKQWSKLVDAASKKPYIVQRYVDSKKEHILIPNSTKEQSMHSTVSMYIVGRRYSGLLCRSSPQLITNFYAGGVFRPAYVVSS